MPRLIIDTSGPVWQLQFHNPPEGLMDQVTATELSDFLDQVEASDSVRAVVLSGSTPGVFIRHYDVGELSGTGAALAGQDMVFDPDRPIPESPVHTCLRRMEELPVPFIAAINGMAMGGGLETALACDLRLVQDGDYDLGLPEITVGLLPGAGGTQRLTRVVGEARALQMILTGATIKPQQALEIGLVAECVSGDVVARALEVAGIIAAYPALAAGHIKHLVRGVARWSPEEGLARERTLFCDLMVSPESQAAMVRMLESGGDIRAAGSAGDPGD